MSLLVSYEPAFETRRSLQRSFQRRLLFFCIFVCSDFFFAFFLVLDFFFNVSMDFSFDKTREEMQKKIFYSWPQQTFFQLFFFSFSFSSSTSTCADHTSQLCKTFSIYHIAHIHNYVLKRFNIFRMLID